MHIRSSQKHCNKGIDYFSDDKDIWNFTNQCLEIEDRKKQSKGGLTAGNATDIYKVFVNKTLFISNYFLSDEALTAMTNSPQIYPPLSQFLFISHPCHLLTKP